MSLQEEEVLIIDVPFLLGTLRQKRALILAITIVVTAVSAVFTWMPFDKQYRSEAKLLFNPSSSPGVITDTMSPSQFLQGLGSHVDPFKNQEELLKSQQVALRVYERLQNEHISLPVSQPEKLIDNVLDIQHVDDTDFIKISAKAATPETAQKIAEIYVDTYFDLMNEILYSPLKKQEELFSAQVDNAEQDLNAINQKMEDYQRQNGITDIDTESQLKLNQVGKLVNGIKATQAMLSERKAEVSQTLSQLNIHYGDIPKVIKSVAGGQDGVLAGLQNRLYDAVKEYDVKSMTYAPTNPDMQAIEEKINVIKKQIADQQILTVGESMAPGGTLIKDELRSSMIDRLVTRDAQYKALEDKLGTMQVQLASAKDELKDIPQQELQYAKLKLEHQNREEVLTKLQQKLADIKIQKSTLQKSLVEVDPPNLPRKPDSPLSFSFVLMMALASFALSSAAVVASAIFKPMCLTPDFVEDVMKQPVLAIIPWLPEAQWQQLRRRNALEVTTSNIAPNVVDAYQYMAINLKAQRSLHHKKALVVSSLMKDDDTPFLLSNLAYCLAQSGERVVLVETNFRQPKLHEVFNQKLDYENGLTELINDLSERLHSKKNSLSADEIRGLVEKALTPSGLHPQLFYMNAGVPLNNTFEFLNSSGLRALAESLRNDFDWILFDTPPFLKTPDAAVLLGYLDGLLLFVEQGAGENQLRLLTKRIEQLKSTIVGVAMREAPSPTY